MANLMEMTEWKDLHPTTKHKYLTAIAVTTDGEVIENAEVVPSKRALTQAQITAIHERKVSKDMMTQHTEENGGFFNALFERNESQFERFPQITKTDMARILYLATFIRYNDNTIKHRNGRCVDKAGLIKLLGMSRRHFVDFIDRVKAADIINEGDGEYAFNPSVFYRGQFERLAFDVSKFDYTRVYRKTVRYLYEKYNSGRQLANVGIIFAILPYISYGTNVVCENPDARDIADVKPTELGELAQKLGYASKQKLKQALNRVKLDDVPVFLIVPNPHKRNEHRVIVNTSVVFAGDGKALASIKAMNVIFNQ